MKTRNLLGYVMIPALALAVLSGCKSGSSTEYNFDDAGSDPGDGTSHSHEGPNGSPTEGTGDVGGPKASDAGTSKPGPGKADAALSTEGGSTPPAPGSDDPQGIDAEYLDDGSQASP